MVAVTAVETLAGTKSTVMIGRRKQTRPTPAELAATQRAAHRAAQPERGAGADGGAAAAAALAAHAQRHARRLSAVF